MKNYTEAIRTNNLIETSPLALLTRERLDIPLRANLIHKVSLNALTEFYKKIYGKMVLIRNGAFGEKTTILPLKPNTRLRTISTRQ